MQWDETSLFIHLEPAETSTRSRSVPNPRNGLKRYTSIQQEKQSQETQGFVTGVQPHTLRSTSPFRNPQRVDLYTYVTFLPLATTKIKLELLTQFRGDTNFLGQPQTFGCFKATPSRLGA
jgi:hypothetical protein